MLGGRILGSNSVLDLWRVRGGRRAAVQALQPYVERARWQAGGPPGRAWLDPYLVGFLTTLITRIALRAQPGVGSEALGLVQVEAWSLLTGGASELIGERILTLSLAEDAHFLAGHRDAADFDGALLAGHAPTDLDALWDQGVGARLAGQAEPVA
ncbi:hypothetical protein [Methylobacterium sp. A54F]